MNFPEAFLDEMKTILNDEFEAFLESYEKPHYRGVRLNTLKCSADVLQKSLPFSLSLSPFSPLSYYAQGEEKVGMLPAHHAGMFYSQEPSASSAVTVLEPKPGEKILDLCAAPGGKSSQIAALLEGKGLLWSNEIVKSRANILLSNLERMGVRNAVVSSCHPQRLCEGLTGYFDRVLVDAPCSGEGMFRRDPAAIAEWTPEGVEACAQRQRAILDSAALTVREGGILVYSTCTFSVAENEDTVTSFLQAHPEFELSAIEVPFGRKALGMPALRIFPMDGGEGHFVAKFRRVAPNSCKAGDFHGFLGARETAALSSFYESLFSASCGSRFAAVGDRLYLLPEELPTISGLGVLRAGIELGEKKGNRVEPAHALFLSQRKEACHRAVDFSQNDKQLLAFLRGEEIDCEANGYTAVCVNGVVTGFGKASGGRLKNRYPKGLRNH